MTTKIQLRRVIDGGMEDVNPMTSEECVMLEDGKKLKEVVDFVATTEDFEDEDFIVEENLVDRVESIENRIDSEFEQQNSQIATGLSNIKTVEQNISNKVDTEVAKVNAQLSKKANDNEVVKKGYGTLSDFDEETRRVIQGMESGNINAVLGELNVLNENINYHEIGINKFNFMNLNGMSVEYGKKLSTDEQGSLEDDINYFTTGKLYITCPRKYLYLSHLGRFVGYDENDNAIYKYGRYNIDYELCLDLPEDVCYFRVSDNVAYLHKLAIIGIEDNFTVRWDSEVFSTEKNAITYAQEDGVNLFDNSRMTDGGYFPKDGGILSTPESALFVASKKSTHLIQCEELTLYSKTGVAHNDTYDASPSVAFYNEMKEMIFITRAKHKFITPKGAKYFSCLLDESMSNYREYPLGWHPNNFLVCKGELPETYQPYNPNKIKIEGLEVGVNNLSNEIKEKLEKIEDKSFKSLKDTVIVFEKNNDFNSTHFRIPFMCVTNQGTIIAGCDIRYNTWNDHSLIDIGTARSEDGGKTWLDKTVAIPNPGVNPTLSRAMDGTILATKEGRVFLIGNKFDTGTTGWTQVNTPNDSNWDCVLYHSDDDGRTWQFNQSLKSLLPQGQISFLGGVGSGIQMKNGTLVFPIQMARYNDTPFNCQSGIIYSTDNGVTWKMGETLVNEYTSECSIVEYPTGTIMINCRQEGQNHRSVFKTTNLGTTWEETPMNTGTQQTNTCQGHMCKIKVGFDKEVILFTNPINDGTNRSDGAYAGYDRSNLSLSMLQNDIKFTPIHTLYRPHSDGYSCMAFDEKKNRLYVVMELEYNLVFKDITDLLPTIQLYKNLETIGQ